MKRCSRCKLELPLDAFPTIIVRDKRCKPGHSWTGPAHDCRECRKQQKRDLRRRKAEAAGKAFDPRGDRSEYEAQTARRQAERRAEAEARYQTWLANQNAARNEREEHRQKSPTLTCQTCEQTKPRDQFHKSEPLHCKACIANRDADSFTRDRETLADSYVRQRIANDTGLRWSQIPDILVETKRIQLAIQRIVNPRTRKAKAA